MGEMDSYEQGEIDEMIDIYKRKGMSEEHAKLILTTMAQYKDIFVDHGMVEELGIMPPGVTNDPKKDGIVMFFSFAFFGLVPLLSFMILVFVWGPEPQTRIHQRPAFVISCVLSTLVLAALGAAVAWCRKQSMLRSSLRMSFNGCISGSVAYCAAQLLMRLI